MDYEAVAFIAVLALAAIETLLSGFWNRVYFTIGVPVFTKEVQLHGKQLPTPEQLETAVQSRWSTPLLFRRLSTGEIAFRERAFGGGFFHYTPMMHGIIRRDPTGSVIVVQGLLNWFIPALVALAVVSFQDLLGAGVVLSLGLAVLYSLQRRRFIRVADAVQALPAT